MEPYSVVITSCGRFDLLRRTLASLLPSLDRPFEAFYIVEDSGQSAIYDSVSSFGVRFEILMNERNLGQIASIDRAYQRVTTPLIFHCEDDWEFLRSGFLTQSARLLALYPDVSMVGLRSRAELNPLMRDVPSQNAADIPFYFYEPRRHPEYFSYSFNPGLRRLDDYRQIGPFARLGHEPDISYAFKKAGFRMAALEEAAVRHIGWDRHVDDPNQPLRSRTLAQRLSKSVAKRVKRLQRRFGG
jgi:GT2 family glycosyltransferase